MSKVTLYLFILKLFRMSLSIVTLPLTAKYFGVSFERDAWILTITFFSSIGLAFWGPIDETFRTKFVFLKETEGEKVALSKAISLVGFTIIGTLIISTIIYIFSSDISFYLNPLNNDKKIFLIISLILLMTPTLLINQITSIGVSVLNAYDVFYLPEIAGTIASICNLVFIVFLAPLIGIYSLVISQYISILLLLVIVIYYLKKQNLQVRTFWIINWVDVKVFLFFALPFFLPYFAGQVNSFAEKWLSNTLGNGKVSTLDYARQFSMILQAIISSVLTTVMVPMLAKSYAKKDLNGFMDIIKHNITTIFVIMCLTVPILIGGSKPLSNFFFGQGKVTLYQLEEIANLISLYGFSLVGVILYLVFGLILLASNKGKKYAFWGVLAQVIVLFFNIFFIKNFNVYVFPISLGIGHFLTACILSYYVELNDKWEVYLQIVKNIFVLLIISSILYLINLVPITNFNLLQLAFNGMILMILIALFSFFLDINILVYSKKIISKFKI